MQKLRLLLIVVLAMLITVPAMAQNTPADLGLPAGDRILAWVAPAPAPNRQAANQAGEIVYFNADGTIESVLTLPDGTTRVTPCGNATSPDGETFAFVTTVTAGNIESGNIYTVRGTGNPTLLIEEVNPMSCVGSSTLQYTDDSAVMGLIDYRQDAEIMLSVTGTLQLYDTSDNSLINSFENITDFDLGAGNGAFIGFFKNDRNEATEVAVFFWDGSNDREVATIVAEEDCYYTSGSVETLPDGRLVAVLGNRCNNDPTTWEIYLIDPSARSSQRVASGDADGRYFTFTESNSVYSSPDGSNIFFTVPDGLTNRTVRILAAPVDSLDAPETVVDRFALMPSLSALPYVPGNASAQVSPDGRYLAVVQNTPNNDATLNVIDLSAPDLPPIQISAGDRRDTFNEVVFSDDSSLLFYVAGADAGGNNSLFVLNLSTGSESRVTRGRFAQGVLSPAANLMAVMKWEVFNEEEPPYLTLLILDTFSTAEAVIYDELETDDRGNQINPSFAYPLSWRAGSGS
jgi:hypothetical protein